MTVARGRHVYTWNDYLAVEAASPPTVRHEFIDGEIFAMAGGSGLHSMLIAAISGELYVQIRGGACGLAESNLRIRVLHTGNAFHADGVVVCGEAQILREREGGDTLLNPTVIVEVVSPSTEAYDRGGKFDDDYRFIPSLQHYVLVAQGRALIEVRTRDPSGTWTSQELGPGMQATLPAIGAVLDVDAVYREATKNLPAAAR